MFNSNDLREGMLVKMMRQDGIWGEQMSHA